MPAPDPSPRPTLRRRVALVGAMALGLGTACRPDDDGPNRALLETLPLDRRADLLEDLARFDALPLAERTAIRRLDATLAALPPDEQARLRALLQHYHVWSQGLTEEQRAGLRAAADPEERSRLARQLRAAGTDKARPGSRIARLRPGDFGLVGPYEMAHLLQVWLALAPDRRAAIDRKPWKEIQDDLKAANRSLKIRPESLPADAEKQYDDQLRADADFRPLIEARLRRIEQATKNGKPEAVRRAENDLRHDASAFAQFLHFEEHPPKFVAPERIARFADAAPEWLRAQTDSLAPDDARAYYGILYRLIYPAPREMPNPPPTKPAPGKAAAPGSGPARPTL